MRTIPLTYEDREYDIFQSIKRKAMVELDANLTNEEFVMAVIRDWEARRKK